MFRRTTVSAEDAIERSKQLYHPLGGKFNGTEKIWRMPHGGRMSFCYLETVSDADEYQGRNVTDAWVEECGQYPLPDPIDRLNAVLRSAAGVPTQLILTGNPGGAGQHWLSSRYKLIPLPKRPIIVEREHNGVTIRCAVIPSRVSDNRVMLANDPGYLNRLKLSGSEKLVRAWLDGDWSAVEGAFFDCWSDKVVIEPFEIPESWLRFRSFDWGSAKPFSVGWWAAVGDTFTHNGQSIPRGALIRYREYYGASSPNVGLKMVAEDVAKEIIRRGPEKIGYSVADPAIFTQDGGPSIAERMRPIIWKQADNKRVARAGQIGGWDMMRYRIKHGMIFCFNTCKDSIRTIPVLQHDIHKPEDVDTDSEDHAPDDWRYACMSRPWIPTTTEEPKPKRRDYGINDDEHDSWLTI